MANFMAKWSDKYPGQSGHIHVSLQDLDGKSLFSLKKTSCLKSYITSWVVYRGI